MTQQKHQTTITEDAANKKLVVVREFDGTVEQVWKAWTESEQLDKWWAPRPWKAITKLMDFKPGGFWLYDMSGPNGESQWCRVNYESIDPLKSFTCTNSFCDENGNPTNSMPAMHWENVFTAAGNGTKVTVTITFDNEEDLKTIIKMGFKEGFTMGLGNLDELLAK